MSTTWWSQPFAAEGAVAAEGIIKQLGTPSLDPLSVLVREAAQNSWDARTGEGDVRFGVSLRRLGSDAARWRSALLPGPDVQSLPELDPRIGDDCPLLIVSDRGTEGLSGPLRADMRVPEGQHANFVQFLRNVGEPRDRRLGGGTYGFGKGIYYRLSRTRTILVHSRVRSGLGGFEHRVMAAALGSSYYAADGRRYTGRHWWGRLAGDGVLDPVTGQEAVDLAGSLALPTFDADDTGTDIVVLDADLGGHQDAEGRLVDRDVAAAADFVVSSMLWNLWPKFIPPAASAARMVFTVELDGSAVEIPDPARTPALAPYVEALTDLRSGGGAAYARTRAPRDVGRLAVALCGVGQAAEPRSVAAARPYGGEPHHVARMRMAELVVDYRELPPHPNPALAYAAVFRASAEADDLFASAEPPTHDDWNDKGLSGTAKGVIQGAWRFIRSEVDALTGPVRAPSGAASSGLGALATQLATLVPATAGGAAGGLAPSRASGRGAGGGGRDGGTGGGGVAGGGAADRGTRGGSRKDGVALAGAPWLAVLDNVPYVLGRVTVEAAREERVLTCEATVILEGGAPETDKPTGASVPRVLHWLDEGTGTFTKGETRRLPAGYAGSLVVYCSHVPDAVVRLKVRFADAD